MAILVTGAAGFIGSHVAARLLARGETVIGVDNVNAYYDVRLKEARLARLLATKNFSFHRVDIGDTARFNAAMAEAGGAVAGVVHLAAQAGVRHSITHPFDYITANIVGHLTVMEWCRHQPGLRHMVYASSSSVYGGNTKFPFSVEDRVDHPISLYAATKKADELMSHTYSHLYRIPQTGLRFFTVYGPWGRPDMALFLFCKAILAGEPITIFNNGNMRRDFTYIDDIVTGVVAALDNPPEDQGPTGAPHRVFNIGNNRSEPLMKMVELLETALGRPAIKEFGPMQPGDVEATYADITATSEQLGYAPTTPIDVGIPRFVAWYREHYGV
ncbi:MAG: SDR family NAD(P)-dependent oxidoreductase [Rhodospirillaceae bacterium]